MRRTIVVALACALLVAGCGSDSPARGAPSRDASIRVEYVQVGDRAVPCILWDAPGDGGLAMSCDWTMQG